MDASIQTGDKGQGRELFGTPLELPSITSHIPQAKNNPISIMIFAGGSRPSMYSTSSTHNSSQPKFPTLGPSSSHSTSYSSSSTSTSTTTAVTPPNPISIMSSRSSLTLPTLSTQVTPTTSTDTTITLNTNSAPPTITDAVTSVIDSSAAIASLTSVSTNTTPSNSRSNIETDKETITTRSLDFNPRLSTPIATAAAASKLGSMSHAEIGKIVGGVVGSVLGSLALIILAGIILIRRKRRHRRHKEHTLGGSNSVVFSSYFEQDIGEETPSRNFTYTRASSLWRYGGDEIKDEERPLPEIPFSSSYFEQDIGEETPSRNFTSTRASSLWRYGGDEIKDEERPLPEIPFSPPQNGQKLVYPMSSLARFSQIQSRPDLQWTTDISHATSLKSQLTVGTAGTNTCDRDLLLESGGSDADSTITRVIETLRNKVGREPSPSNLS
ncbi:hypothetical protein M422DRAFT_240126 [Sphaerobolus stellatus SS14]|nr:hypothetical protein M422DRAFT_240126 [Sphaerobolus stellatus SS14]